MTKDKETRLQAAIDYHHSTEAKRLDDLLWIHANELPAREKFVLLAMGRSAESDDGTGIRASVQTIADRTGYSRRSILEIQPKMIQAGYLVVVRRAPKQPKAGPGRGITNEYRIDLDKLIPVNPLAAYRNYRQHLPEIRKGAKSARLRKDREPEKVQYPAGKGADPAPKLLKNSEEKNSNAAADSTVEDITTTTTRQQVGNEWKGTWDQVLALFLKRGLSEIQAQEFSHKYGPGAGWIDSEGKAIGSRLKWAAEYIRREPKAAAGGNRRLFTWSQVQDAVAISSLQTSAFERVDSPSGPAWRARSKKVEADTLEYLSYAKRTQTRAA